MSKALSTIDGRRGEVDSLLQTAWGTGCRLLDVRPLAGDASSRRYYRLKLNGSGPPTAVLMIQPDTGVALSSEELAVFREPLREMPFLNVQRYLRAVGIAVPEIYASAPAQGLILLEDLGDVTLWEAAREASPSGALGLYRSAIDEMIALQLAGERRRDESCLAFQQRFDARLFLWELDHFLEYGFTGRTISADARAELRKIFESLAADLGAEPAALAHRDYHSWNLFVRAGRIRVIDFQDALLAPPLYDLASLLTDRATPTLVEPDLEWELVQYYCRRRAEQDGAEVDEAKLRQRYFRHVLQRALKVVGRFHYLEEVKAKRGYRQMLPDTIRTVRRALENLPDLRTLQSILVRSFPELE